MTEKRFTLKYINEQHISANLYDNGTFIASIGIGAELIVELLNTLSEKNEQLKEENKWLKSIHFANDVLEENKQLKSELAEIKRQEQEVIEYLQTYHNGDVNELKKELKE